MAVRTDIPPLDLVSTAFRRPPAGGLGEIRLYQEVATPAAKWTLVFVNGQPVDMVSGDKLASYWPAS